MELTEQEILSIREGKTKEVILNNGKRIRIFLSGDVVCRFKPKSKRYGWALDLREVKSLVSPKPEKSLDEKTFKVISKFRKQALKANFQNEFIEQCKALPDTFEKWVEDGKKSPYEYGVTTGCSITGDLISIKSLLKKLSYHDRLKVEEAIKNKISYQTGTFELYGYDGSIQLRKEEDGTFRGWLSKEYRNCGNGYYYLLINDDYFIGYDVD